MNDDLKVMLMSNSFSELEERWNSKESAHTRYGWSVTIASYIFSMLIFFRLQLLNGFSVLISDRSDGIIEVSLLEHWYSVLRGFSKFNQTMFFYPVKDTLGYNDGYFLYGLIYSIFRICKIDPFLSSELVNFCILTIGFFSFFVFVHKVLKTSLLLSSLGSVLFVLSSSIYLQAPHAQLFSIGLAPCLAFLMYKFYRSLLVRDFVPALSYGLGASLLHAVWLISTFYMAYYFAVSTAVFIVYSAILSRNPISSIFKMDRKLIGCIAVVVASYCVFNVPFFLVYYPKLVETGQHDFSTSYSFIPSFVDIFNIGPDNLIFGKLYALFDQWYRPDFPPFGEKSTGFPPFIIVLFLFASFWFYKKQSMQPSISHNITRAMTIAVLVTWVCVLRFGSFSIWSALYYTLPGAKTVRVVARYQIFLTFPVCALIVAYMNERFRKVPAPAFCLIVAMLILEQITLRSNVGIDHKLEMARLRAVPAVPQACRSFFAVLSRNGSEPIGATDAVYSHNVDAMIVAEYIHLPTVNGLDTFVPPNWNLVRPLEKTRYLLDVIKFALSHGVANICSLDLQKFTWDTHPLSVLDVSVDSTQVEDVNCAGTFDIVRGPATLKYPAVEVAGWADRSWNEVSPPDQILMQLKDGSGEEHYLNVERKVRSDVSKGYNKPQFENSGFNLVYPIHQAEGAVITPIVGYGSHLYRCRNLSTSLSTK